jgi:NADH dehydrogenase FAD-containing subunit
MHTLSLFLAQACGLDPHAKRLHLRDGRPPLPYDVLSLDIGSSPQLPPTLFAEVGWGNGWCVRTVCL